MPRFYQVELTDRGGRRRCLALDLAGRATIPDATGVIREVAATVGTTDAGRRARTSYVDEPSVDAVRQPIGAYVWGDGRPNTGRLTRHLDGLFDGREVHRFHVRTGSTTILRMLARSPEPTRLDELAEASGLNQDNMERLMVAIGEDYDVVRDDNGVRFRSKVMRERWARHEAWVR